MAESEERDCAAVVALYNTTCFPIAPNGPVLRCLADKPPCLIDQKLLARAAAVGVVGEIEQICNHIRFCHRTPIRKESSSGRIRNLRQRCVKCIQNHQAGPDCSKSTIRAEVFYKSGDPATPYMDEKRPNCPQEFPFNGGPRGSVGPDVVIVNDPGAPPARSKEKGLDNIKAVVEIKFPSDRRRLSQIRAQQEIAGDPERHFELDTKVCACRSSKPEHPQSDINWELIIQLILIILSRRVPIPRPPVPRPIPAPA